MSIMKRVSHERRRSRYAQEEILMSSMPGAVEDGFWMVLLIVAFAFLWFRTRTNAE